MTAAAAAACPKQMVHGPCGGVREDQRCELGDRRCAFVDDVIGTQAPGLAGTVADAGLSPAAALLEATLARRPLIVADLPSAAGSAESQRAAAAALAGHVDAALLGDAPWARVQLPPTLRAAIVAEQGVPAWAGLNCRDRNRVALEGELAGLAAVGAAGVHCVTGDHPQLGDRADAQPVFDLDGPRLAALAAGRGLLVSVAEAPSAPPAGERAARAALKAGAGAGVCFVNHAASVEAVAEFAARVRELAPQLRLIACVPLAVSAAGAQRLAAFTGSPAAAPAATAPRDPIGAGVRAAVTRAEALLAVEGIAGVDLSAASGPGEELQVAAALALAAAALGGGT